MNVQSRDTGSVGHNIKNGYQQDWKLQHRKLQQRLAKTTHK